MKDRQKLIAFILGWVFFGISVGLSIAAIWIAVDFSTAGKLGATATACIVPAFVLWAWSGA